MKSGAYIGLISGASILSLGSFLSILWFFSPENSNAPILFLLFFSLFFALCGLFSLIALYFHQRKNKQQPLEYFFGISFREGTLLSSLLVGYILLQFFGIFYWWLALIFLIIIVAIELAFLGKANKVENLF